LRIGQNSGLFSGRAETCVPLVRVHQRHLQLRVGTGAAGLRRGVDVAQALCALAVGLGLPGRTCDAITLGAAALAA